MVNDLGDRPLNWKTLIADHRLEGWTLDWKCRTLSLTSTFIIWVHITMSVDSVEKSISSHCYSISHTACLHVYKTDIM